MVFYEELPEIGILYIKKEGEKSALSLISTDHKSKTNSTVTQTLMAFKTIPCEIKLLVNIDVYLRRSLQVASFSLSQYHMTITLHTTTYFHFRTNQVFQVN